MKLAVIGGGSTYTPELVAGLARERERLDLTELVLHDVDPERSDVVGGLAGRMLDAAGYEHARRQEADAGGAERDRDSE